MRYLLVCAASLVLSACVAKSGQPRSDGGGACTPCVENGNCDLANVCRDGCCVAGCDGNDDCGENQICRNNACIARPQGGTDGGTTQPSADGGPSGSGAVGDACTGPSDCASGSCNTDLPGGYCTVTSCSESSPCPPDSECYQLGSGTTAPTMCIKTCTSSSQCRQSAGYVCDEDDTCWPGTSTPSDGGTTTPPVDGGGGAGVVACNGTPASCAAIGPDQASQYYGCCAGNVVYWCDDQTGSWSLHSLDCPSDGKICGYEPSYESVYCTMPAGSIDLGPGPGPGPGPTCDNLPPLQCTSGATSCGQLISFDPRQGEGYDDYPINGETAQNQYRSWLRRDMVGIIKYATAKVKCKTVGWNTGNEGVPLGLGDMSEQNGAIPGTSINDPGHPPGTHTNGFDIDLAYYQRNTPDNKLRPICVSTLNGREQYHCTADPIYLDVWRHAAFLGFVLEHSSIRVIGVDGKAGPLLQEAMTRLCTDGWLTTGACGRRSRVTFETTDTNRGWYLFHHHHSHISLSQPSYTHPLPFEMLREERPLCIVPDCSDAAYNEFRISNGLPPMPPLTERWIRKLPKRFWERPKLRVE
jgi:hypothetical protein